MITTIDRPAADTQTEHSVARPERLFELEGGGSTLEDLVLGVWEDLAAGADAECPVCGFARLRLVEPAREVAECGHCGSALS